MNNLLTSQLDRFDQLVAAAKKYVHIDSAAKDGKENTSEYAVRALGGFAIKTKEHIASCDKERLMWVVELIASRKVETLGCQCDYPCVDDCFCMCHEYFAANVALEEILSLIKKEIGVTE